MPPRIEQKFNKSKNLSGCDKLFDVEPRGIEPLNPNTNYEVPYQGWPLELHKAKLASKTTKRKPEQARTFGAKLHSAVGIISLARPLRMSIALSTSENMSNLSANIIKKLK